MPETVRDAEHRIRALDPSDSFIVQSPAGSGKTELLIQRFLTLLSFVDQPESIVAITFTRKAAGEMRHRVIGALQKAASGSAPEEAHERHTWELSRRVLARDEELTWQLIQHPSRLRIQTIDSFCGSLVRQMPWVSRMGASPQPEDKAGHLYRQAARATLDLLETGTSEAAALGRLLEHLDNNLATVETLLTGMLRRRDQWLRHVVPNKDSASFREMLQATLKQIITDELERTRALFPSAGLAEVLNLAQFAARHLSEEGTPGHLAGCIGLTEVPGSGPDQLGHWLGLAEMFLTQDGSRRKVVNKNQGFPPTPEGKAAKTRWTGIVLEEALITQLHALRSLPPATFNESQWEVLSALLELLPVAAAQLKVVFQREGKVDFTEIAQASRTALGTPDSPTDLAFALDCRIQHLLVDEFQDTSQSQYALLETLTAEWQPHDGRTLFLVGDPMQSIYGFREADVALFLRARERGIGNIRLTPLTLSVNFRSGAAIVDWVNQALGPAFPPSEDLLTGAVTYERSVAFKSGRGSEGVTVHPFFGNDTEAEADRVIKIIENAKAVDPEARIAVLVRARSHLFTLVSALRRTGQKFRAVEIDKLGERSVVQDLLALTNALLHPADRPSWLALLRAPWCGLTLADLHVVAGSEFSAAIWDLIGDDLRLASMSPDGRLRIERIKPILADAIAQRGRLPLRRWIEGTWMRLGGPACLEDRTGLEDAAAFLDLLEESAGGAGLLDAEKFREDVAALFARPDVEADESLQLLTIHKAKGLEFDTVIVPALGKSTRSEEPSLLLWLEYIDGRGGPRLLLAPIKETGSGDDLAYSYLRQIQRAKANHESTRLLYVAATRARKHLHLLGHAAVDLATSEITVPKSSTFLKKIWDTIGIKFETALTRGESGTVVQGEGLAQVAPRAFGIPLRRLSSNWLGVPPPPDIDWRPSAPDSTSGEAEGRLHITFEWASELQRRVGIVVHGMLQQMNAEDRLEWNPVTVVTALSSQGLAGDKLREAVQRVEKALRATVTDARGLWILGRHAEDQREYALSGLTGGRIRHFTLDRTFVDEDNVRWIIDYKTGAHEGGGLEAFLDNEQVRYRTQLQNYAHLMKHMDSRPIRLGLYFPILQAWREWAFEGK